MKDTAFLGNAIPKSSCIAPTITQNPYSYTYATNTTVSFAVTASGTATLAYQWTTNTVPVADVAGLYGGSTTATFWMTNLVIAQSNYAIACVITNACGSVTSSPATLTVKEVWSPTNAYVWFNASFINKADGSAVTNWQDASGNRRDLWVWSGNALDAPYFTNTGLNSLPATYWLRGVRYLGLTNNFGGTNAVTTWFMVALNRNYQNDTPCYLDGWKTSPRVKLAVATMRTGSATYTNTINAGAPVNGTGELTTNTVYVYSFAFNRANSFLRTNGVNYVTGNTGNSPNPQCDGMCVGNEHQFNTTESTFSGAIAEIIMATNNVDTNFIQWVEANLKTKYSIP